MSEKKLQSALARARGHGAGGDPVHHWWVQRVTAIALVPLSIWLLASLLQVVKSSDPFVIADWLASPLHALPLLALLVALFWHAKLGLQVVIEDYVHHTPMKYTLLLLNTFLCWSAALAAGLAVLRLHMFSLVAGV